MFNKRYNNNMILVFSENKDWNTKKVLEYFYKNKQPFIFFSELDCIEGKYMINNKNSQIDIYKNHEFVCSLEDVTAVWYRRVEVLVNKLNIHNWKHKLEEEYAANFDQVRKEFLTHLLQNKKCVGVFGKGNFNKLEFLKTCIDLDISIPNTLVSSSKLDLEKFLLECKNGVIVKAFTSPYAYPIEINENKEIWKRGATIEIDQEKMKLIPTEFHLSLFQEKINKIVEIRVFYFNDNCYSQAIFSQESNNGKLDYRLALNDGSNLRQCFYKLPEKIEQQVIKLMHQLNLDIGVLDIIYSTSGEYVFLEVNPSGQYGDASDNTNQNFEYKIANYLMTN